MGGLTRRMVMVGTALLLVSPCAAQGPRHGLEPAAIAAPASMVVTGGMAAPGLLGRQRTWWFVLGGAALGAVTCTAISNLVNDGSGFSTCTTSGYVGFVAGGAATGLVVAALTDTRAGASP